MDLIIHACDISNPTKPYEIYNIWANKVMNEFYLQGDKEKNLGIPVSFLCDRNTTSIPQGQIGFIEGVVFPFFDTFSSKGAAVFFVLMVVGIFLLLMYTVLLRVESIVCFRFMF